MNPQVVAKEDFAFVVPASVTAGALVAVVREAVIAAATGQFRAGLR